MENNSDGFSVKISVGYRVAVACLSVCQCMCLIGFLPVWHVVIIKKNKNPRGLITTDSVEAW